MRVFLPNVGFLLLSCLLWCMMLPLHLNKRDDLVFQNLLFSIYNLMLFLYQGQILLHIYWSMGDHLWRVGLILAKHQHVEHMHILQLRLKSKPTTYVYNSFSDLEGTIKHGAQLSLFPEPYYPFSGWLLEKYVVPYYKFKVPPMTVCITLLSTLCSAQSISDNLNCLRRFLHHGQSGQSSFTSLKPTQRRSTTPTIKSFKGRYFDVGMITVIYFWLVMIAVFIYEFYQG